LAFTTILYEEDGPIGWLTLNRPDDGNMFTPAMCHEIRDCIEAMRRETRTRVLVITGAGEKFFCIGGRKEGMEDTRLYAGVLPTLEMYESIDRLQKPVIASVNGFAVGGGNVLQEVCDLTIAKESAIFRQVGPMMGSFDAGYGTWYLEDLVGKKKAKELWYLNPKIRAREALEMGLINRVVADSELRAATRACAARSRSPRSRRRSMPATAACPGSPAWRTICSCASIWKARNRRSWARPSASGARRTRISSAVEERKRRWVVF
jgi:naphthoate synthase